MLLRAENHGPQTFYCFSTGCKEVATTRVKSMKGKTIESVWFCENHANEEVSRLAESRRFKRAQDIKKGDVIRVSESLYIEVSEDAYLKDGVVAIPNKKYGITTAEINQHMPLDEDSP